MNIILPIYIGYITYKKGDKEQAKKYFYRAANDTGELSHIFIDIIEKFETMPEDRFLNWFYDEFINIDYESDDS